MSFQVAPSSSDRNRRLPEGATGVRNARLWITAMNLPVWRLITR